MKASLFAISTLACFQGTAAIPMPRSRAVDVITDTKQQVHSTSLIDASAVNLVPRGGDLGPLSSEKAAQALVGIVLLRGLTGYSAIDGVTKSWGFSELSEKQKVVFQLGCLNMLCLGSAGFALLKGSDVLTATAAANVCSLPFLCSALIDDYEAKYGVPKSGLLVSLALQGAVIYTILSGSDMAPLAVKIETVYLFLNIITGFLSPKTFGDAWGLEHEEAVNKMSINGILFSMAASGVLFGAYSFLDISDSLQLIGYSMLPLTLLTAYNGFLNDVVKNLSGANNAVILAVLMGVLNAAILLK